MSETVSLPLVMLQKAQQAAEAAAASARLLETEAGHRLTSIEARLVGIEGRLSGVAAGLGGHALSLMRIADTQSEHTAQFTAISNRLDGIEQTLAAILAKP